MISGSGLVHVLSTLFKERERERERVEKIPNTEYWYPNQDYHHLIVLSSYLFLVCLLEQAIVASSQSFVVVVVVVIVGKKKEKRFFHRQVFGARIQECKTHCTMRRITIIINIIIIAFFCLHKPIIALGLLG